ncbi:DMT family transporter [Haloferax mediterranei ATCC 33500]|uniref:Transporter n=1 Tax=Haloferax mediterranei (strain ATCC 33500 / DSM 1411 / JCM 8866 / NBRC 14739 / NCIMB 2177 / R-4) TaxID=523841 RepID=I3R5K0_HALMT|nr:DMT family transporter [Haloferax mediterranei]AFK19510.1 transporter of the drug/metabolite transporter (DMT) superfamily [Haloferax mediterranei ATCC 33500]AHZ21149.1 transporter [Haloferax mediterranei ATCC 33500]EMA04303.1 transporter of the drug/metabolite transporter (DMT) superfamily protein [Haloferax mediterranei ATCC 33500]MDX5989613.1 DMT family transporter [Haloferax mediterranei ATCC 33500]QCQ75967.1 DMT family transporter [Haloferax mediterranei ATCC 33500]
MTTSEFDGPISPFAGLGVAILAISTSAILVRWSTAPSLVKAFYRVVFTVALLAPVALIRHRGVLATISHRDLAAASGAGVALAAHFASWFESLNHTTVAASVTLVQAQPLFVAVGAWAFLDERVSRRTTIGIGVALAGMVLMSVSDLLAPSSAPRPLLGNGLAVVGAVTAAAYVLTGRSVRSRVALVPYVVVVYSVCAVTLLAVTLARGDPLAGYPLREWLLFLGMALGPGIFGHTVINWALAHLESSVVSVSLLGEPVGSTILALFLLTEIPTLPTVLGGAVVLFGIYITAS